MSPMIKNYKYLENLNIIFWFISPVLYGVLFHYFEKK